MRADIGREDQTPASADSWGPGYRIWQSVLKVLAQRGPDGTTSLVRMGSHLIIVLVAVAVIWISRVQLPSWEVQEADIPVQTIEEQAGEEALAAQMPEENAVEDDYALERAAVPITLIPDRPRIDVITHTVTPGDTLYGIAKQYGLSAETIMWANGLENNPDLLRLGQKLTVLPTNGVYHTVAKADTLDKIAKGYKVTTASIVNYAWNRIDPRNPTIAAGQKLIVPGGVKSQVVRRVQVYSGPVPANAKKGTGRFVWPTSGYISQTFKRLHPALDIARATGTPIKASDSGYVVRSGWSTSGYGNFIVIDHGNGYQTLYAHLSRIFVKPGDVVGQGTEIGLMGSTGRSTGPHLHFEIRKGGIQLDPLKLLH